MEPQNESHEPQVYTLRDRNDIINATAYLRRSTRPRPCAVTSAPQGKKQPLFDPAEFCEQYGMDVFVLVGPEMLREWSQRFPDYHLTAGITRFFPAEGSLDYDKPESRYVPRVPLSMTYEERLAEEARHYSATAQPRSAVQPKKMPAAGKAATAGKAAAAGQPAAVERPSAGGGRMGLASAGAPGLGTAATQVAPSGAASAGGSAAGRAAAGQAAAAASERREAKPTGSAQQKRTAAPTSMTSAGPGMPTATAPTLAANLQAASGVSSSASSASSASASAAPTSFSPHALNVVSTQDDLEGMLGILEDDERDLACVVVTRRDGFDRAFVDAALLASDLDDVAWVFEIADKRLEFRMSAELARIGADDSEVYNGAIRIYPAAKEREYGLSEDRFLYKAFPNTDARQLVEEVESGVYGLRASGWVNEQVPESWREITAEVTGVLDSAQRAMLRYSGRQCIARPEEVLVGSETRGLPISRILQKGMVLHGRLDPSSRMLVGYSDGLRVSPEEAVAGYEEGQTVLGRLVKVAYASCTVALFPGVTADVEAKDVCDPGTLPVDLYGVGQVVPVLIVSHEGGEWLLSILQADSSDVQPAPPILRGGPSWLALDDVAEVPRASATEEGTPQESDEAAALAAGELEAGELSIPDDLGEDATMYLQVLYHRLRKAEAENESLRKEAEKARRQTESLRRNLLSQRQRSGSILDRRYRRPASDDFSSEAERQQYEAKRMEWLVTEEWTESFEPGERKDMRLPASWSYSDQFFETLADVDVRLGKVVRCVVDVLLRRMDRRQEHPLRANEGAEAPQRLTKDGMPVLRCYVEQGHPQAARLHYAYGRDGKVVFMSVRKHDDVRI